MACCLTGPSHHPMQVVATLSSIFSHFNDTGHIISPWYLIHCPQRRSGDNFRCAIFQFILTIDIFTSSETALNFADDKSTLVQVNGLLPTGYKPLSEPMLTKFCVTVWHHELTHCGLVTPYGDRDLGQHWLR